MQFEAQGIHIRRVTVWSWSEAQPMQDIFSVILLAIIGLDHSSVLLLILVEELDGTLPAGKLRLVLLQGCQSRRGGCAGLCLVSRYRGVLF